MNKFLVLLFLLLVSCGTKKADLEMVDWYLQPRVYVCVTAPVTVEQVQASLDLWAKAGAPQLKAYSSYCLNKEEYFVTYIDLPTVDMFRHWGSQTRALTVAYSIGPEDRHYQAHIGLLDANEVVLLHEIGHIWFTGHTESGTVMAEYLEEMGPSFEGLAF